MSGWIFIAGATAGFLLAGWAFDHVRDDWIAGESFLKNGRLYEVHEVMRP